MAILYAKVKKTKPANTAAKRALASDWQALVAAHSKPLERGAKAKGVKTVLLAPARLSPLPGARDTSTDLKVTSVPMKGAATLPSLSEDLYTARQNLAARVGMSYNKGGLQYLSDDEIKEQRTGVHKRR